MTFAPVGSLIAANATPFTLTPAAPGDLIIVIILCIGTTSVTVTGISSSNVTWTPAGASFTGPVNGDTARAFLGKVTAAGADSATVTFSGATPELRGAGQEFSSSAGSWASDAQAGLDSGGTATMPSITPAGAGELYQGFEFDGGTATAGSTAGYTYDSDSHGNGLCFNPACGSGAQAPVWASASCQFGLAVMVRETAAGPGGNPVTLDTGGIFNDVASPEGPPLGGQYVR